MARLRGQAYHDRNFLNAVSITLAGGGGRDEGFGMLAPDWAHLRREDSIAEVGVREAVVAFDSAVGLHDLTLYGDSLLTYLQRVGFLEQTDVLLEEDEGTFALGDAPSSRPSHKARSTAAPCTTSATRPRASS